MLLPFSLAAGRAEAADDTVVWTPVHATATDRIRIDLELTLRARRLLIDDAALARYEISVRIDDRVAELTGAVPSMDVALRAESDLRGLLGLSGIRNQLAIKEPANVPTSSTEPGRLDSRASTGVATSFSRPEFASRFADLPSEASLSWRPARPQGSDRLTPVPFLPEGLSRPTETREPCRENDASSRDNLRIGRIDVVRKPAEARHTPEVLLLPPIDVRHSEDVKTKAAASSFPPEWLRFLFVGF